MLRLILNWLSGGLLDKLLGFVERREAARLAAMNDEQRRAHDERVQIRQNAQAIRLATASFWEQRILAAAIALPFVVHLYLVAYDTFWPQPWNVEKWPAPFDDWEGIILLSYFGVVGLTTSVRAVASAKAAQTVWRR